MMYYWWKTWTLSLAVSGLTKWVLMALWLGAVISVAWTWIYSSTKYRLLNLLVRIGCSVAIGAMALGLTLQTRQISYMPNHIAVVIDTSSSMGINESSGGGSRLQRASAFLQKHQAYFKQLAKANHVMDWYTVDDTLQTLRNVNLLTDKPLVSESTELRQSLITLRQQYGRNDLAGVILISDGIENSLQMSANTSSIFTTLMANYEAPIYPVWIGNNQWADLSIEKLNVEHFAFTHHTVNVELTIKLMGSVAREGTVIPVRLWKDAQMVAQGGITVQKAQENYKIILSFVPTQVGSAIYEIEIPQQPTETYAGNNHHSFILKVIRDKIRVVHVAGRPSWDVKFLRRLLQDNLQVQLVSFYTLRKAGNLNEQNYAETSLIPFPCEELFVNKLKEFDVLILQDFPYQAYCGEIIQPSIAPFINQGGALLMIGGEGSFAAGGYANTELTQVLPVELPVAKEETKDVGLIDLNKFNPQLSALGKLHPITALHMDPTINETLWQSLPPLSGINLVGGLKPQAQALLEHPKIYAANRQLLPVLSIMDYGKGRSSAWLADSSWRWQMQKDHIVNSSVSDDFKPYQQFYEQLLKYLVQDPGLSLLKLELEPSQEASPQQKIKVHVALDNPNYTPAINQTIQLQVVDKSQKIILNKSVTTDEQGTVITQLAGLPLGAHVVTAHATIAGRPHEAKVPLLIQWQNQEHQDVRARSQFLEEIAHKTQGKFIREDQDLKNINFIKPNKIRVNQYANRPLGQTLWNFLFIIGLFALLWFWPRPD